MNPFFSIIIPVYNVEKYLNDCIKSVLSQNFESIETILIDDGSTDSSSQICKMYSKKFDTISYFRKENGGLSKARNYGILKATGEYLIFLDSDDFIEQDSLTNIYKILVNEKPDVLIGVLNKYYDDNNIKRNKIISTREEIRTLDKYEVINKLFPYIEWSAPKYIVKKEIVKKNNLKFKEGYLHEDVDWTTNLFLVCNSYSLNEIPFYYHRMMRHGSITNTLNSKRIRDVVSIVSDLILKLEQLQMPREVFLSFVSRLSKSTFFYFTSINFFDHKEKLELKKIFSDNIFILKYSTKISHKILYYCVKLLGIDFALTISWLIRKRRLN